MIKMDLKLKRKLIARMLKCSPKRIYLDPESLEDIKNAITREDLRILIHKGIIRKKQKKGVSRVRARKLHEKKKKGHRKGIGSRKGKKTARRNPKRDWINKVRKQRKYLKKLKEKGLLSNENFKLLYKKSKSGFFRSLRHLKLYIEENGLISEKNGKK